MERGGCKEVVFCIFVLMMENKSNKLFILIQIQFPIFSNRTESSIAFLPTSEYRSLFSTYNLKNNGQIAQNSGREVQFAFMKEVNRFGTLKQETALSVLVLPHNVVSYNVLKPVNPCYGNRKLHNDKDESH
jgi:hypothetical protein